LNINLKKKEGSLLALKKKVSALIFFLKSFKNLLLPFKNDAYKSWRYIKIGKRGKELLQPPKA